MLHLIFFTPGIVAIADWFLVTARPLCSETEDKEELVLEVEIAINVELIKASADVASGEDPEEPSKPPSDFFNFSKENRKGALRKKIFLRTFFNSLFKSRRKKYRL